MEKLNHSLKTGLAFGLTSGVITTLGLIVGLNSSTHSKAVVLSGILVIAIADAMSDAFGIHMSEESANKYTGSSIRLATITTFLAKFIFASTFIVPILLFDLSIAVIVSIIWGFFLLGIFSYFVSNKQTKPWHAVIEHLTTALLVIVATYYVGQIIGNLFKV